MQQNGSPTFLSKGKGCSEASDELAIMTPTTSSRASKVRYDHGTAISSTRAVHHSSTTICFASISFYQPGMASWCLVGIDASVLASSYRLCIAVSSLDESSTTNSAWTPKLRNLPRNRHLPRHDASELAPLLKTKRRRCSEL